MGYNIEVSFNILKNSSVAELQAIVRNLAEECGCESFYEDYEYETNTQFKRNHCIMTVNFEDKSSSYEYSMESIQEEDVKIYTLMDLYNLCLDRLEKFEEN
jgi:hypothetical protein